MKTHRFGWALFVGSLFALTGGCAADPADADDIVDADEDEMVASTEQAAKDGKCNPKARFEARARCYKSWARRNACSTKNMAQEVEIMCQLETGRSVLREGRRLNLEVKEDRTRKPGDNGEYVKIILTVGGE